MIFVPVSGGIIVGGLNTLRSSIKTNSDGSVSNIKGVFRPFLKAVAASFTLGTGNSLGPEGPSVEIGSAIAKGFGNVFGWEGGKKLSLVAAGSAAGIASGKFYILNRSYILLQGMFHQYDGLTIG